MRWGGRNWRSTAVAATASGGATTAPSAIAAAHGIIGMSVWATTATAPVVNPTANTTRLVTGAQSKGSLPLPPLLPRSATPKKLCITIGSGLLVFYKTKCECCPLAGYQDVSLFVDDCWRKGEML
jgi:hypothetical protein